MPRMNRIRSIQIPPTAMLAAMHLLHSTALGAEIIDEVEHQIQGKVTDLVFDADRGKLLALLVRTSASPSLFALQTQDILSWGKRIHIRDPEVLGAVSDIVRLQPFLRDRRRIIRQPIRTKGGVSLGKCADFQFTTEHFELEWIFPRRFLQKGIPLPASDIIEITDEAIIVKEQGPKEEKIPAAEETEKAKLDPLISPAPG